jgi:hypothetical protein
VVGLGVIAGAVPDNLDAPRAWLIVGIVAIGYIVSRGLDRPFLRERRTTNLYLPEPKGDAMKVALLLRKVGFTSTIMHSMGLASIGGAISLWGRSAARSDKAAKARAERLAIFVGLWPPTFFLLGKVLQDLEATPDEQVEQARIKEAA